MKIYKKIIVTFVTAILTILAVYGGYTIYADDEDPGYYDFVGETSFYFAKVLYHDSMNKYFNDKLKTLVELTEDEKFYKKKDFVTPPNEVLQKSVDLACIKNVSSYCVAMGALNIHMAYLDTLNSIKGRLPEYSSTSIDQILKALSTRNEEINKEVEDAKLVMEAAIAAYDEFRMAYPVHQKYREIIKSLTKYRIALKKIQNETVEFPLRFVDATSSKCE